MKTLCAYNESVYTPGECDCEQLGLDYQVNNVKVLEHGVVNLVHLTEEEYYFIEDCKHALAVFEPDGLTGELEEFKDRKIGGLDSFIRLDTRVTISIDYRALSDVAMYNHIAKFYGRDAITKVFSGLELLTVNGCVSIDCPSLNERKKIAEYVNSIRGCFRTNDDVTLAKYQGVRIRGHELISDYETLFSLTTGRNILMREDVYS